jgi:23S rRNA-intervening sequence protein
VVQGLRGVAEVIALSTQQSAISGQHSVSASEIPMKNFRDLMVWQKAHALTLASYRGTAEFPKQEIYGLTSQIRRCSASIAANIAEGCG